MVPFLDDPTFPLLDYTFPPGGFVYIWVPHCYTWQSVLGWMRLLRGFYSSGLPVRWRMGKSPESSNNKRQAEDAPASGEV